MALFTVLVHEFVIYFDFVIIPSYNSIVKYLIDFLHTLIILISRFYMNININIPKSIFHMKIIKIIKLIFNTLVDCVIKYYYSYNHNDINSNISFDKYIYCQPTEGTNSKDFMLNNKKARDIIVTSRVNKSNIKEHTIRRVKAASDLRRLVIDNDIQDRSVIQSNSLNREGYEGKELSLKLSPNPMYFEVDSMSNQDEVRLLSHNRPLVMSSLTSQDNETNISTQAIVSRISDVSYLSNDSSAQVNNSLINEITLPDNAIIRTDSIN
jgi:hypothetical protein